MYEYYLCSTELLICDLLGYTYASWGSIGQPALLNDTLHLLSHFITESIVTSELDIEF